MGDGVREDLRQHGRLAFARNRHARRQRQRRCELAVPCAIANFVRLLGPAVDDPHVSFQIRQHRVALVIEFEAALDPEDGLLRFCGGPTLLHVATTAQDPDVVRTFGPSRRIIGAEENRLRCIRRRQRDLRRT